MAVGDHCRRHGPLAGSRWVHRLVRDAIGAEERLDAAACCEALRQRGFARIGLHGASLGAAAIAYAQAEGPLPGLAFVVPESCYDDIRRALSNRLGFVPFARVVFLPVEWAAQWRLGVDVERLQPMQALRRATVPTLVVAGDADTRVRAEDTQRLFDACGSPNKRLLWVRGGGHVDLWEFAQVEYAAALTAFLRQLSQRSAATAASPPAADSAARARALR